MSHQTKKCHTVPLFYLKKFCNQNGKLYRFNIENYRKFGERWKEVSPKSATVVNHGYSRCVELYLKEKEDYISKIYNEVISKGLSDDNRFEFLKFVMLQLLRTPKFMREVFNINFKLPLVPDNEDDIEYGEAKKEIEEVIEHLTKRLMSDFGWAVLKLSPTTHQRFITSDNPVVTNCLTHDFSVKDLQLGDDKSEMSFPLTPTKILYGSRGVKSHPVLPFKPLPDQYIKNFNILRIGFSDSSLYANRKSPYLENIADDIGVGGPSREEFWKNPGKWMETD